MIPPPLLIKKSSKEKRRLWKNCSRDETGDMSVFVADVVERVALKV
jgi:hypothetical protein